MSRVGKNHIIIPSNVNCRIENDFLFAKGQLGELKVLISKNITVELTDNSISMNPVDKSKSSLTMWGTLNRLTSNIINGVNKGFTKNLEITGVGYRASVQGAKLVLQLGYSHDIEYPIPSDLTIKCDKPTSISITGIDKKRVGQTAAIIRSFRKPEPYKGKGVRYDNEVIRRKEGKKK